MRFILGLISGAAAAVMLAAVLEVPTDRLLSQTVAYGQAAQALLEDWQQPAAPARTVAQTITTPEPAPAAEGPAPPPDVDAAVAEPLAVVAAAPAAGATAAANAPVPDQTDQASGGEAAVWSPFHSEASASGFASRLARQLQHPFEVRRQGPANYQVVYDYTDEQHRETLQQQIGHITGAPSS